MRVMVINNGNVYPAFEDMAKRLHAKFWIRDFHPPNGCIGTIMNNYKNHYLIRFDLCDITILIEEDSIAFGKDYWIKYEGIGFFNEGKYKELLKSKSDFIEVVIDKKGFEIMEDYFKVDDFIIRDEKEGK